MSEVNDRLARIWTGLSLSVLPFAESSSGPLPIGRLLRLSLFQISCGMTAVLMVGTLNRVMIVELGVAASLVAIMVALPLLFAPLRALIGFRSDTHRSFLGWRRVPYLWLGSIIQFGGLAMMPFALLILSGDTWAPPWVAQLAAGLAFLMVGAGMHTVQTVGLALATDIVPRDAQPNVVTMLSLMQLLGMVFAAMVFGAFLANFSQIKLIQLVQGVAVATLVINLIAAWKQEPRRPEVTIGRAKGDPDFRESLRILRRSGPWDRRLLAAALGTAAFGMQDVLLEPYGGQILSLSVGATTALTALFASGAVLGFLRAVPLLSRGLHSQRVSSAGAMVGISGFLMVIFAAPMESTLIFAAGTAAIGFGAGLFAHATLTACMQAAPEGQIGLTLGVWGAVTATAAGAAVALGGIIRDVLSSFAASGILGMGLDAPSTGYVGVYIIEIILLFLMLAIVGPLVRADVNNSTVSQPQPGRQLLAAQPNQHGALP
jgi:BCD family chlorophyll transporter-like MFS transporter